MGCRASRERSRVKIFEPFQRAFEERSLLRRESDQSADSPGRWTRSSASRRAVWLANHGNHFPIRHRSRGLRATVGASLLRFVRLPSFLANFDLHSWTVGVASRRFSLLPFEGDLETRWLRWIVRCY